WSISPWRPPTGVKDGDLGAAAGRHRRIHPGAATALDQLLLAGTDTGHPGGAAGPGPRLDIHSGFLVGPQTGPPCGGARLLDLRAGVPGRTCGAFPTGPPPLRPIGVREA